MLSTLVPAARVWLPTTTLLLALSACYDARDAGPIDDSLQVFELVVDGEVIEAGCERVYRTVSMDSWRGPAIDTNTCELNGWLVGVLPDHVERVTVSALFSPHVFDAGEPTDIDLSDPSSARFAQPRVSLSAPGADGAYAIYGANTYDEERWIDGASGTVVVRELHADVSAFDIELRDLVLVKIESSEAPGAEIWPETIRVPHAVMRRIERVRR